MKKFGYSLAVVMIAICSINMGTGGSTAESVRPPGSAEQQDIYLKRDEAIIFARAEDEKRSGDVEEICLHDPGNKDCWIDGVPFGIEKFRVFPVGRSGFITLKLGDISSIEILEDRDTKRREIADPDTERKGKFVMLKIFSKNPTTGRDDILEAYIHSDVMLSFKFMFGGKKVLHQVPLMLVDRIVIDKREGVK